MTEENKKTCFVIAPIGEPESETRRRSDQVLRHIIRPAVEPLGYAATRADEIAKPGIITSQVIQRVVDDHLVIADLTDWNPNVFYELAIRHAIAKPFVQVMKLGEEIPFDVAGTRTVFIDLQDPDNVANAKLEISEQIKALEISPSDLETPITVSIDLQRLRGSEKPDEQLIAGLLATLAESRRGEGQNIETLSAKLDEIGRSVRAPYGRVRSTQARLIRSIVSENDSAYAFVVVLSGFRDVAPWLYEVGMEAFRKVVDGDIRKAGETYQELNKLIYLTRGLLPESLLEISDYLPTLFDRMIQLAHEGEGTDSPPWYSRD